jgi:hypothetical protein
MIEKVVIGVVVWIVISALALLWIRGATKGETPKQ